MSAPTTQQAAYYTATAATYDAQHGDPGGIHDRALRYVVTLLTAHACRRVLDVGCGTGRGVAALRAAGFDAEGLEPVAALLAHAVAQGLPPACLHTGSAYALPWPAASFDAVCAFGVMHHLADPARALAEMQRVARVAICLSDSNRFGQGRPLARRVKYALWRLGLWPLANRLKTRGRGYLVSAGDGISYSYSVYDSVPALTRWGTRVWVLPTEPPSAALPYAPHLAAGHGLLCAVRD